MYLYKKDKYGKSWQERVKHININGRTASCNYNFLIMG